MKPASLTFEQAATVPIAGTTALQAVRDAGKVRAGQTVLIVGAGGGVGLFAVQIANALGARVTGVCSTTQIELVRSLGADAIVDYTKDDFTHLDKRYDVIVVFGGGTRCLDFDKPSHPKERSSSVEAKVVASGSAVVAV